MAYTRFNYRTKKALKDALVVGTPVRVWQPGPFSNGEDILEGKVLLEGPHYPEPHRWYAQAWVSGGNITKVT